MVESLDFVHSVQSIILDPNVSGIWPLFLFSFINEVAGIFPFVVVLAGQLIFLKTSFSIALVAKLLVFVSVPVGLGSAFGSMPLYAVAYFGGKPAISKFHRYLHFSWSDVERVNARFKGMWYDDIIFFLLRCVPILPSMPLNIAAGVLRMGPWPFWFLTAVGAIIRMMLTLLVVGLSIWGIISI